ncbi:DIL domain-containing protein [Crucibulum laeve]|uniref:DIL domain-containing protein n=1 Tax=Crucibulum laeve TaxID=68775 RepID=A0A5C3M7H4_9AGAR|nr:DIL domain-containing protein [Crucibulum laeve]
MSIPSTSSQPLDLSPEPDLHPLHPTIPQISGLLASQSGLSPLQKAELLRHCLSRACVFGDIAVLQYLLSDPQAQMHVDLGIQDEDGVGLVSLAIHGFGADSDHDVEREECIRLLVSQGADMGADKAGWTPLHYAALLAPPTMISYLMTHGCSPFAVTERKLTPLDVVTAHSTLPGREDVALLLEESMRGDGWTGGRMEQRRRVLEQRSKRKGRRREVRDEVGKILGVNPRWWGSETDSSASDSDSEDGQEDEQDDRVYTPIPDYSSMLVFSPPALPQIFDSLITNFEPSLRNGMPANTLYMLARFACLMCDHTWLEDLIIGATDTIEENIFARGDDITCLVFWLYNATLWLHLLQCDNAISEACEMLGSFDLIEEVINSIFVFVIRFAERKIDQLLDMALLDFTPMPSEFEAVQFESEWSFLRSLTGKRNATPNTSAASRGGIPQSPPTTRRPLSPSQSQNTISSTRSKGFSSLRETFGRGQSRPTTTPLSSLFPDSPPPPLPTDLTSFLTALHTLMVLSDINPVLITQLWSQVMYWTSCEIFNRVITRKKYLCRSRAIQISMNLTVLEDWIDEMCLPLGIQSHFVPVRDLLNWLQRLSSITEFPELVATIQTMKSINPLQMRRAVRDYKYEVNEGRMTEECIQYLTQLQKDWERHRVKLGVEALRKERNNEREGSVSSSFADDLTGESNESAPPSITQLTDQHNIDLLFERTDDQTTWEPMKSPQALGELLDSRYMLPLLFPSDPRLLAAIPVKGPFLEDVGQSSQHGALRTSGSRSSSRASARSRGLPWRSRNRKVREIGVATLQWVDGVRSAARWGRPVDPDYDPDDEEQPPPSYTSDDPNEEDLTMRINTHITPLTRKPSGRSRGRPSMGETTPIGQ